MPVTPQRQAVLYLTDYKKLLVASGHKTAADEVQRLLYALCRPAPKADIDDEDFE